MRDPAVTFCKALAIMAMDGGLLISLLELRFLWWSCGYLNIQFHS